MNVIISRSTTIEDSYFYSLLLLLFVFKLSIIAVDRDIILPDSKHALSVVSRPYCPCPSSASSWSWQYWHSGCPHCTGTIQFRTVTVHSEEQGIVISFETRRTGRPLAGRKLIPTGRRRTGSHPIASSLPACCSNTRLPTRRCPGREWLLESPTWSVLWRPTTTTRFTTHCNTFKLLNRDSDGCQKKRTRPLFKENQQIHGQLDI